MSRGGRIGLALLGVLGAGVVGLWLGWVVPTRHAVDIGAAMLAKQVCSCVYVANRDVADCRADEFAVMDPIRLELLRDEERVRAWLTGLGERSASHTDGLGCTLD